MPKENKRRGRREEKKRKREHDEPEHDTKRVRKSIEEGQYGPDDEGAQSQDNVPESVPRPDAMPFYGMLDESEQEYFRKADEMLELNQFDSPEEQSLFLANVYKEADGKELKIANSQSCSRLMERLILLSTPEQLKGLFQKFSGHFLHLVQHRFASHCCEALFIHAAPIVSQELTRLNVVRTPPSSDPDDVVVSMENLFLYTLAEMEGYFGYLMTDRFASHVLRVLLVVLAGVPLPKQNSKSIVQSKKKEKISIAGAHKSQDWVLEERKVPQSFLDALEKVTQDSVSGLDSTYLRALAMHPTGNPTLQVLLQLELKQFGKTRAKDENSIIRRLLPDDPITEGTESASFINGLVYDQIGSRLLETIIEFAPGRMFKTIYGEFFKNRMGSLARNEIAGYVAGKLLGRLSAEDLREAMVPIVEQIPSLVERNRTVIIRTLIERCQARGVDMSTIKAQVEVAYSGSNGFEIARILRLGEAPSAEDGKPETTHTHSHSEKLHGSLLAQSMIATPGPLADLIFDSLAKLGTTLSLRIARDPVASRTVQVALKAPHMGVIYRRKVIQQFYGHVGELALDPAASHVIDAVWEGTTNLAFIRERIAEELAENEGALRESHVGRAVWRNWSMDLYKRRRGEWVKQSKSNANGNEGFQAFPETDNSKNHAAHTHTYSKHLTAIERARLKHAAKQTEQPKKDKDPSGKASSSRSPHKSAKREKQPGRPPSSDQGQGKEPLLAQ